MLHDEIRPSYVVVSLLKIMNVTGARIRAVRAAESKGPGKVGNLKTEKKVE